MEHISDTEIIRGILENNSRVIKYIDKECTPMVERMVINSGGDFEQAKDVLQEAWVIIINKLHAGELELTCKFSTYIYAICKKLWIQEKRKRTIRMRSLPKETNMVEESDPMLYPGSDRIRALFYKHFDLLSKDCQKILNLHLNETPIEEIQKLMNYKNSHHAMDRKYRCKKSLVNRIYNDPNYKSVKNEYTGQI